MSDNKKESLTTSSTTNLTMSLTMSVNASVTTGPFSREDQKLEKDQKLVEEKNKKRVYVKPDKFILVNPDVNEKVDGLYRLEGLFLPTDVISLAQLRNPDVKKAVYIPFGKYCILKPLYTEEKVTSEHFLPENGYDMKKSYASFVFSHSNVKAVQKGHSYTNSFLCSDLVREIAFYRFLQDMDITPRLIFFDVSRGEPSFYIEKGHCTLNDIILKLSEPERKSFSYQLIHKMYRVSKQGMIHSDIKPENLIISQTGKLQIIDWEYSCFDFSHEQTRQKCCVGTTGYLSPELMLQLNVGYKTDIYSVGMCIFSLYTKNAVIADSDNTEEGCHSIISTLIGFEHKSDAIETMHRLVHGPSRSVDIKRNLLKTKFFSENLADLLSRMLDFNPRERADYPDILLHPFFSEFHPPIPEEKKRIDTIHEIHTNYNSFNQMKEIKSVHSLWGNLISERDKIIELFRVQLNFREVQTVFQNIQLLDICMGTEKIRGRDPVQLAIVCFSLVTRLSGCREENVESVANIFGYKTDIEKLKKLEISVFSWLKGKIQIFTLYDFWSRDNRNLLMSNPEDRRILNCMIDFYKRDSVYSKYEEFILLK